MNAAHKVVEVLLGEARPLSPGMKRIALDTVRGLVQPHKFKKGDIVVNINRHDTYFGRKGVIDRVVDNVDYVDYNVRWGGGMVQRGYAERELKLEEAEEPKKSGLSPGMKQMAKLAAGRMVGKEDPIYTSWTGNEAFYVSPPGDYGVVGSSELAMHTGIAGKPILRYALFKNRAGQVVWAHIEILSARGDKRVTDGTVGELLPFEVRQKHGL
jgi:hypothetical protein